MSSITIIVNGGLIKCYPWDSPRARGQLHGEVNSANSSIVLSAPHARQQESTWALYLVTRLPAVSPSPFVQPVLMDQTDVEAEQHTQQHSRVSFLAEDAELLDRG